MEGASEREEVGPLGEVEESRERIVEVREMGGGRECRREGVLCPDCDVDVLVGLPPPAAETGGGGMAVIGSRLPSWP